MPYYEIGKRVSGESVYGRKAKGMVGTIIDILPRPGDYRMEDIITVKWDDGQVAKFHFRDSLKIIEV